MFILLSSHQSTYFAIEHTDFCKLSKQTNKQKDERENLFCQEKSSLKKREIR